MMKELKGIGAVQGIAIGKARLLKEALDHTANVYIKGTASEEEEKYKAAQSQAIRDIEDSIRNAVESGSNEEASILKAFLVILKDPTIEEGILEKIRQSLSAPEAVEEVYKATAALFQEFDNTYLKERGSDITGLGRKLNNILLGKTPDEFHGDPLIVCGDEIDPSTISSFPGDVVKGIILKSGSTTSHSVIIARSRGLVTVTGVGDSLLELKDGDEIILDGNTGKVILEPDERTVDEYIRILRKDQKVKKHLEELSALPVITRDGREITLAVNIGGLKDMERALEYGCRSVGLFRTEYLFMGREEPPTEEEQYEVYRQVIEKCGEELCIIRTLDIGGDKPVSYLNMEEEKNPFLGLRGIRLCLSHTDIFMSQMKAVLRAGVCGKAAIMLPMVTSLDEIIIAKWLLRKAKAELDKEGIEYEKDIPMGIMVETPAAALTARSLAWECDFFSIGTNDLTQYTLAVDRGNDRVSRMYDHFHPGVLTLIDMVIQAAHACGKWVGVCGEMAGDPVAAALLVSMGIDELSMNAPSIPMVRDIIRKITSDKKLISEILTYEYGGNVREHLGKYIEALTAQQ